MVCSSQPFSTPLGPHSAATHLRRVNVRYKPLLAWHRLGGKKEAHIGLPDRCRLSAHSRSMSLNLEAARREINITLLVKLLDTMFLRRSRAHANCLQEPRAAPSHLYLVIETKNASRHIGAHPPQPRLATMSGKAATVWIYTYNKGLKTRI